ncbi:histidine utilization repressor [Phreatobacter aquaticus]|uniref:Histidine utilization repressor n=1 Tax=Phreatobacter aquaticus TaxID=2570229 RepID=A0A4D7QIQ6_9HYPH|nr:histidine utilization repressor [Phreatobacter aquaticus]QCK87338.1 histidine utilization repressor [Phreatobacter aquaticus]
MNASSPPLSLHQRILGEIEGRIRSGEWPPGYKLPAEEELALAYGCSRMTMNKALGELARAGLIERRRKAGSFVSQPPAQSAVLAIPDIGAEVAALGVPYRFEVLSRATRLATKSDLKRLIHEGPTSVLVLHVRHFAGSRPFCLERRIIDLATVPDATSEPFLDLPPGTWLKARVPWTAAEHRIRAVGADAATAEALSLSHGTACLVIERRTWSDGCPVTSVELAYPGDANELVAVFTPFQS